MKDIFDFSAGRSFRIEYEQDLVVDLFAGGGGASTALEKALGRPVDVAVNHDLEAIGMHTINHPSAKHLCENIREVDPKHACGYRSVGYLWASPDCRHFSRAKGAPLQLDRQIRGLAWMVVKWAGAVRPKVVFVENVAEFLEWGPVDTKGRPIKAHAGDMFRAWKRRMERLGYVLDWRVLSACDFGAPTSRTRLFIVARRDGRPISWPSPTHGAPGSSEVLKGELKPYRTAAECIDWSDQGGSIFERKKPLVDNTLRRIAVGLRRYVVKSSKPYLVTYYGAKGEDFRGQPLDEPLRTQTTENRHACISPVMIKNYSRSFGYPATDPVGTVTGKSHDGLASAFIVRNRGTSTTISAGGLHHGVACASLLKYFGTAVGQPLDESLHTVTSKSRFGLVETCFAGDHREEVKDLLRAHRARTKWGYEFDRWDNVLADGFLGEMIVHGEVWTIADIKYRMLQPRELFRAQGFPDSYVIDRTADGRKLTKTSQVRLVGNSVPPAPGAAVVSANAVRHPAQPEPVSMAA